MLCIARAQLHSALLHAGGPALSRRFAARFPAYHESHRSGRGSASYHLRSVIIFARAEGIIPRPQPPTRFASLSTKLSNAIAGSGTWMSPDRRSISPRGSLAISTWLLTIGTLAGQLEDTCPTLTKLSKAALPSFQGRRTLHDCPQPELPWSAVQNAVGLIPDRPRNSQTQ